MRIVTLGHSQVGKTTYMASLYGELQRSHYGFTLATSNSGYHNHFVATAKAIRKGVYPPPTAHRSEYVFSLKYNGSNVLEFTWSDYRGGAVGELTEREQTRLLIQDLENANGLMLLCDGDALARKRLGRSQIGRMIAMLGHALRGVPHPISLAIAFTKSDLVSAYDRAMLRDFGGLINAIQVSDKVFGVVIPVACGRTLFNVALPLYFSLETAARHQATRLEREMKDHVTRASMLEAQNSGIEWLIDQVKCFFTDETTNDQRIATHRQAARSKQREFAKVKHAVENMTRCLQHLPRIIPGMRIDDVACRLNQTKSSGRDHRDETVRFFE
jgi:hypothetical protein